MNRVVQIDASQNSEHIGLQEGHQKLQRKHVCLWWSPCEETGFLSAETNPLKPFPLKFNWGDKAFAAQTPTLRALP